jgi:copper chaperone NosL
VSRLSRILLAIGSFLLIGVLARPIWSIRLVAPQYPEGLGMEIHAGRVQGHGEHDLENVNKLNHYIGMKPIESSAIPELRFMPWIIGALALGGLVAAAVGRRALAWAWLIAFGAFGIAGLVDFWRWEYNYGHDLDLEHAIIMVPGMTYQPPLVGERQLLNFTAASWPATGAALAGLAFLFGVAALIVGRRRSTANGPQMNAETRGFAPLTPSSLAAEQAR